MEERDVADLAGAVGTGTAGAAVRIVAPTLDGIEASPPPVQLDVKPYVVSDFTSDRRPPAPADDLGADIGLDVRYGITQNVAADLTVNTDFAQVEADEQQVNLTRFSLFFPEKREFFLENQGLFAFGGASTGGTTPILFYSRRVGLDEGRIVRTRAGGRLTGRAGRYGFGLMGIRTGQDEPDAPPSTTFTVARLERDILRRSSIGVLATDRFATACSSSAWPWARTSGRAPAASCSSSTTRSATRWAAASRRS